MDIRFLKIEKDLKDVNKEALLNSIYRDIENRLPVFVGTIEQNDELLRWLKINGD